MLTKSLPEPLTLVLATDVADWYEHMTPRLTGWLVNTYPDCARDIEDIVQDIFVGVIKQAHHLVTLGDYHRSNYVYRIAKSVMAQRYRDTVALYPEKGIVRPYPAAHAVALSSFADAGALDAEPVTASHDWTANATQMEQTTAARMSLRAVWEAVPAVYRELLRLIFQGCDRAQIAEALGTTEHAVDMRICRMRGLLRDVKEQIA